jgi:hypothetical protein
MGILFSRSETMEVNGYKIEPYSDLRGAYLQGATLQGAELRYANLQSANLRAADLRYANLHGANLRAADLRYANLRGANLHGADLPFFQIPQEGTLIVWKKVIGGLVKLRIPAKAKRTASLVGRKCRAEYAKVLEGIGDPRPGHFVSSYDGTRYRVGDTVYPDKYDPDIRVECTHGIHFFLTREEAEAY